MMSVRRFMWARPLQKPMDDWQPLDITTEDTPSTPLEPAIDGLATDAANLQAAFETSSSHLDEVRARHTEVLVTAGMLPETGLADRHPERALAWIVESINGRMNPDGLTVPLLGTTEEAIRLHVKNTEDATLVKLDIHDPNGPPLVRELPLPAEASETLQATFVEGRLHLRW